MPKAAVILILTASFCVISKAQQNTQVPAAPGSSAQASSGGTAQGAGSPQGQAPNSTSSGTVEDWARKYIDLWNTGDKAAIESFPEFVMHNHGGRVVVGSGMLGRVIANWRKSMPDLTFTVDDMVAQSDRAAVRVTLKGTYKERLFPEAGDPKSPPRLIRAMGMFMFKVKDGKLQDVWQALDEGAMKVQMGAEWKTHQELAAEEAASKAKKQ